MSVFLAIKELATESQLAKLGAKVDDVILSLGGAKTRTNEELSKAVSAVRNSGNAIAELVVARGEELLQLKVDAGQPLGIVCDNQNVSGFEWTDEYAETTDATAAVAGSGLVTAKSTRRKFRLIGLGIGFSVGFLPSLSEGVGVAVGLGVFTALIGYVVAEIGRHFLKNQRDLPNMQNAAAAASGQGELASEQPATENKGGIGDTLQGIVGIAVLGYLGWTFFGPGGLHGTGANVYTCESHTLSKCETENFMTDCLFTNNARVPVATDQFSMWSYDKDGVPVEGAYLNGGMRVAPGQTVHVKFFSGDKAHDTVLCSVDPMSNVVGGKGSWKPAK